jgi:hypothetical protein
MNLEYLSLEKEIVLNWFESLITKSIAQIEGKPLKDGRLDYYKQEFLKQFCTHLVSIRTLTPGLKLVYKGRENEITASASVLVLVRACLENYSMFYYIYRDSNDFRDTYFKFWSWFREGLMHRQRYSVDRYAEKLKEEKQEIDRIFDELREYPLYQLFTSKQKGKYLKDGTWYFSSKRELLEKAGFSKALSNNCYNFFSSYTHPTSGSHLQTSQADYETSSGAMDTMLTPLFICSGLYLRGYSTVFPDIFALLNEKDKAFVASWCMLGRELMK